MAQTHHIIFKQPSSAKMGASFKVLLTSLERFNQVKSGYTVQLDMSKVRFVYPFFILPVAANVNHLERNNVNISIIDSNYCQSYLDTILFPEGFDPLVYENWNRLFQKYRNNSYIPILKIPTGEKYTHIRDEILTAFGEMLMEQQNITGQLFTSLSYLISEAFDNIVEHANVHNGWIMVQNYHSLGFIDVCIADTGSGLLQTYQNTGFSDIVTHEHALLEAINGRTTKLHEKSRGFGIRTSRHMLVNGLNGKYFMFSGNAFYVWTNDIETIQVIDSKLSWNGTMIALRIPKRIPDKYNYVNYLE
jgi:anti-sigma regulatory factor (Ser/Thr protein kinase)